LIAEFWVLIILYVLALTPRSLKYLEKNYEKPQLKSSNRSSSVESIFLHEFWEDFNAPKNEHHSFLRDLTAASLDNTITGKLVRF
jgi:hypothetical protein